MHLEDVLSLLLPKGRYLSRCPEPPAQLKLQMFDPCAPKEIPEKFIVFGPDHRSAGFIYGRTMARYKLWRVIKKDNDLAFRKQIDRYYISRAKILSLRKNNPIKRIYKALRSPQL